MEKNEFNNNQKNNDEIKTNENINRNHDKIDSDNNNNQNYNYNNANNNTGQNPNNYNGNQNHNNQNYNNEQSFLDSVLEKDNPQNKLFLKFLFWLSTIVFALTGWIAIKVTLLYIQFLDLQKGLNFSNDFSAIFQENQVMSAKFMKITMNAGSLLLETASIRNILKYIFIVLVVLLVLIFLKFRRTNNISKFSHINYLSAVIFCIAGITEIKYTNLLDLANNYVNSEKALETGNFSSMLTSLPDIFMIKICFIVLLAFSCIATVTNYFLIFRNKKFEMQDVKKEFRVIKRKVVGNGQNNNHQNNNNLNR